MAFYYVDMYDEAELYYQLWNGPAENVAYNIGLCHFYRGAVPRALTHFRLALYLMPAFGASIDAAVLAHAGTSVEQLTAEAAEAVTALAERGDAAGSSGGAAGGLKGAAALLGAPSLLHDVRFQHRVRAVRLLPRSARGSPIDQGSTVEVGSGASGGVADWADHEPKTVLQHFVVDASRNGRANCTIEGGSAGETAANSGGVTVTGEWRVL